MHTLWHLRVCEHFAQFRAATGCSKKQVAEAICLHANDLTPSALTNPKKGASIAARLQHRLTVDNLREIAMQLELNSDQFRHLERLAARVDTEISGWPKDMTTVIGSLREAMDMGMNGVELLAAGKWVPAVPLLKDAWCYLTLHDIDNNQAALYTRIRVGTQLLQWHSFQGISPHATALRKELHTTVRTLSNPNPLMRLAVGWAYSAIGTSLMHSKADPRIVIEKHRLARTAFADRLELSIWCMLNEIMPLVQLELQKAGGRPSSNSSGKVVDTLGQVDALVGEHTPVAEFRDEWLLTQLRKIHYACSIGSAEEARRTWDCLTGQDFTWDHLKPVEKRPLRSYLAFSRITLAATSRDFDMVERLALEFCADPDNSGYRERLSRASQLQELAGRGDYEGLVRCIVE